MRIHFDGGVDTVTGSRHRIVANGHTLLRDCGLFQGRREEAAARNREFDFSPADIEALVLSHAHIDHCGNIPTLVRQGFRGPIHATSATALLCDVMLQDAARIQEQDAAYLNQKTNRQGLPRVEPLYTTADAERAMRQFRGHAYGETVEVLPGIRMVFREAGHILGAALTAFELEEKGRTVRVGFAFDLGRRNLPLIRDPEGLPGMDALILESTYGGRRHADAGLADAQLGEIIGRVIARRGKVFIPTFALERAQEIIYHLAALRQRGALPDVPVIVDSPMAYAVTKVFAKCRDYLDDEYRALQAKAGSVMLPDWVTFTSSVEESKALTALKEPAIVLAASGMCEHGRILHHLKHGIENAANAVLIVGYQAEYTLGRRLVEGQKKVKIFGDEFRRRAEVFVLNAFSAHADHDDLVAFVRAARPGQVFLVHGEDKARAALSEALAGEGVEVNCPAAGDQVEW